MSVLEIGGVICRGGHMPLRSLYLCCNVVPVWLCGHLLDIEYVLPADRHNINYMYVVLVGLMTGSVKMN